MSHDETISRWDPAHKLVKPLRWRKSRRVEVTSDLFHESLSNEDIAAVFGVMAACSQHTFQVLTKRAKRMREWFEWVETFDAGPVIGKSYPALHCKVVATELLGAVPGSGYGPWADRCLDIRIDKSDPLCFEGVPWPLPNVHLGVSAENQDELDKRVLELLATPAAVRWVSAEPLLGPLKTLSRWTTNIPRFEEATARALGEIGHGERDAAIERLRRERGNVPEDARLSWIVVGGESGSRARPCDVKWIDDIVELCRVTGTPVFVKQLGSLPVRFGEPTGRARDGQIEIAATKLALNDRKGGDPSEWPEHLRVRQWPVDIK